jgi:hypothetical protein
VNAKLLSRFVNTDYTEFFAPVTDNVALGNIARVKRGAICLFEKHAKVVFVLISPVGC